MKDMKKSSNSKQTDIRIQKILDTTRKLQESMKKMFAAEQAVIDYKLKKNHDSEE